MRSFPRLAAPTTAFVAPPATDFTSPIPLPATDATFFAPGILSSKDPIVDMTEPPTDATIDPRTPPPATLMAAPAIAPIRPPAIPIAISIIGPMEFEASDLANSPDFWSSLKASQLTSINNNPENITYINGTLSPSLRKMASGNSVANGTTNLAIRTAAAALRASGASLVLNMSRSVFI